MSYTALYRKWRPATFDEVKGQDHIVITVADDGVGMDVSQLSRGGKHHFGVFSVDERIKLNFGTEYGVTVHSQIGCGTTVVITLPYGGMSSAAK